MKTANITYNWRPSNLSELTPIIFNIELNHLGSEAPNYETKHSVRSTMTIPVYLKSASWGKCKLSFTKKVPSFINEKIL